MGSKLPPRPKVPPPAASDGDRVVLPEVGAASQGAVVDWRTALADYLKALKDLGDKAAQDARER
jgi:hypothetical protein